MNNSIFDFWFSSYLHDIFLYLSLSRYSACQTELFPTWARVLWILFLIFSFSYIILRYYSSLKGFNLRKFL